MSKNISQKKRKVVHDKFNGCCAYCGIIISFDELSVDHIFPKSMLRFSGNEIENLNPSCKSCNRLKGTHTLESFRKRLFGNIKDKFYFEKL